MVDRVDLVYRVIKGISVMMGRIYKMKIRII